MSIAAGLDVEMPGASCNWLLRMLIPNDFSLFGGLNAACTHLSTPHIASAIDSGELEMEKLDDSIMRILTALFEIGEFVSTLYTVQGQGRDRIAMAIATAVAVAF